MNILNQVVVIDYGAGNLLSIQRGLEQCGAEVILTADPMKILAASKIVLPGVGAFASAMQALSDLGLVDILSEIIKRKTPLLGVCLGMQLLLEESDEFGKTRGLGFIPGRVIALPRQTISGEEQKIPHIGWNALHKSNSILDWKNTLLENNTPGDAAYFIHSFMAVPNNNNHRIADCMYGGHKIAAMIGKDNIIGCQFHPEKSGEVGLKILSKFLLQ
jgi:glutamine amidotransferase